MSQQQHIIIESQTVASVFLKRNRTDCMILQSFFAPSGDIILKFRRVIKGWHSKNTDPTIYCEVNLIAYAKTANWGVIK